MLYLSNNWNGFQNKKYKSVLFTIFSILSLAFQGKIILEEYAHFLAHLG